MLNTIASNYYCSWLSIWREHLNDLQGFCRYRFSSWYIIYVSDSTINEGAQPFGRYIKQQFTASSPTDIYFRSKCCPAESALLILDPVSDNRPDTCSSILAYDFTGFLSNVIPCWLKYTMHFFFFWWSGSVNMWANQNAPYYMSTTTHVTLTAISSYWLVRKINRSLVTILSLERHNVNLM